MDVDHEVEELASDLEFDDLDVSVDKSGPFPIVKVSSKLQNNLAKRWRKAVVMRLPGRRVGYKALLNKLDALWKMNDFQLIDLDNDFFVVRFFSKEDFQKVLLEGPWDYGLSDWNVAKIDYNTSDALRGKFACVAVAMNLKDPLVSKLWINGNMQLIEYESLPAVCFSCGRVGHKDNSYPYKEPESRGEEAARKETESSNVGAASLIVETDYGSWMVVTRRARKAQNRNVGIRDNQGSHFHPVTGKNLKGKKALITIEKSNLKENLIPLYNQKDDSLKGFVEYENPEFSQGSDIDVVIEDEEDKKGEDIDEDGKKEDTDEEGVSEFEEEEFNDCNNPEN
ncbi:hypothetical protein P3X46_009156 [Hevea brasiliensis]|uniref:DUF4283 domain-containing protein n=1 Tax=Hevea brasiliensis TaxID=3981 RepID=A0ABQ9MM25_HEVBR|nr:hypothetical protein P3X46_009156 [Hevea brasiliensis]